MLRETRPDWDLSAPGLREAWDAGDAPPSTAGASGAPNASPPSARAGDARGSRVDDPGARGGTDHIRGPAGAPIVSSTATTNVPSRDGRSARSAGGTAAAGRRPLCVPALPPHRDPPARALGGCRGRGGRAASAVLEMHDCSSTARTRSRMTTCVRTPRRSTSTFPVSNATGSGARHARESLATSRARSLRRGNRDANVVHRRRRLPRRLRRPDPARGSVT